MAWPQAPGGLIDETGELSTAVTIALCADALADVNHIPPDPNSTDRRGWWADLEADTIWGAPIERACANAFCWRILCLRRDAIWLEDVADRSDDRFSSACNHSSHKVVERTLCSHRGHGAQQIVRRCGLAEMGRCFSPPHSASSGPEPPALL